MHKQPLSRRIASSAAHGISLAEKGLAAYNTARGIYSAGSAIAAATTPDLAAGAAVL